MEGRGQRFDVRSPGPCSKHLYLVSYLAGPALVLISDVEDNLTEANNHNIIITVLFTSGLHSLKE